jgi:hypothetical protein
MAVYEKSAKFIDYCHKIQDLCRTELDSRIFSKKLMEIIKNLNQIKQRSKLKLSIYILEKSDNQ